MSAKPKLAIINTTGCTGCVVSILDLHEDLLNVLNLVDLVYCTTVLDVKDIPPCDIAIIDGTVANEEDLTLIKEARKQAKIVIALGSCACFGGITGLRNFYNKDAVLDYIYKSKELKTNEMEIVPLDVPHLLDKVDVVDHIIKVDYKIPGCPPLPEMIKAALVSILNGKTPEIPNRNLCIECERKKVKMLNPTKEFLCFQINNISQVDIKNDLCFLEQGVLCMGYATREGCKGRCVNVGVPCRGCMGILEHEQDQGCAAITGLASIFPIGQLMKKEDLIGTVYRYCLPSSILQRVKTNEMKKER